MIDLKHAAGVGHGTGMGSAPEQAPARAPTPRHNRACATRRVVCPTAVRRPPMQCAGHHLDCCVGHGAVHHRQPQGGEALPGRCLEPPGLPRSCACMQTSPFSQGCTAAHVHSPSFSPAALLRGCGGGFLHRAPRFLHHAPPLDHQAPGAGGLVSGPRCLPCAAAGGAARRHACLPLAGTGVTVSLRGCSWLEGRLLGRRSAACTAGHVRSTAAALAPGPAGRTARWWARRSLSC